MIFMRIFLEILNLFLELDSEQSENEHNPGGGCSGETGPGGATMVQAAIGGGAVAMERIETIDTGSSTLNNLWRPNTNTNTDSSRDLATLDCKFILQVFLLFPVKDLKVHHKGRYNKPVMSQRNTVQIF